MAGRKRTQSTVKVRMEGAFAFADTWVNPGSFERVEVPVARLPNGSWVHLPVTVVHGAHSGPVVWLSAAVHGDELNGVVIVDEVVRSLNPMLMCGTVLAVPIVNGFGLIQGIRYLPDRRDLNRLFPGSKRGSLGSRLAHLFSELVIQRADIGLDFHTGAKGRSNLAQVRCNLDEPRTRELAQAFGAPVVVHSTLRDGSLRAHAAKLGKPTLLYEAGEADRLDARAIELGVVGCQRVLRYIGVLSQEIELPEADAPVFSRSSSWTRAPRSGFCRLAVSLGDRVNAGQVVGVIMDPALGLFTSVKSRTGGVIIGQATAGLVTAGDAVLHVAAESRQSAT